jgi:heat shock protein HtpX
MRELDPKKLRNPIIVTVIVMVIGSILGVIIGQTMLAAAVLSSFAVLGPLSALIAIPMAIAQLVINLVGIIVIVPIWALLGGWWFARSATGPSGSKELGVVLLNETHEVHRRVNELAKQLDLPPIKWVGFFPHEDINAYAMGTRREDALIALSGGMFKKLTKPQVDAIMAHELAHVANNDMARMTYAQGVQGALTWFLVFRGLKQVVRWLFTPISQLELLRFSRSREYQADAIAAALVGKEPMIEALRAIESEKFRRWIPQRYAHFMFHQGIPGLFSTHPELHKRIEALQSDKYIKRLPYKADSATVIDGIASEEAAGRLTELS